jgi:phosphate transport system permease protein
MNCERILARLFFLLALSALGILVVITVFIFKEGLPIIFKVGPGHFLLGSKWIPSKELYQIWPMIVGSFWVTLGALIIGVPLGLGCAIFLVEFCPQPLTILMRPAVQLLAGIPSVIYGMWGLVVIVPYIRENLGGPGLSLLAGVIILGIMILPTIISISEDALRALPSSYKEGALSLGATYWQTIWRVLVPAARSGIVASIVLGMGRAVGETMAVIMVLGNAVKVPKSILDPARTLTTNIGIEMAYATGAHRKALFATGIILFAVIMILNVLAHLMYRTRTNE